MIKTLLFLIFCGLLSSLQGCMTKSPVESFSFDKIFYYAIQEDVRLIVDSINSFNEESLTDDQKDLKRKYNSRFLEHSDDQSFTFKDSLLARIMIVYQNYWIEVLMKEITLKSADTKYLNQLTNLLISETDSARHDEIRKDPIEAMSRILEEKGYFTRIDRTGNLMDLIVWTGQAIKTYDVKIGDTKLKVPVVLIDSALSYGWEGFSTFGIFYPGGWTTPDTLYCITKDYDLKSEKFLVSYLTHETQHLYDSKTSGGFKGWELEYRAKLAELSVSDSTTYDLIGAFIKGRKNDRRLSHPYAEYRLIKELSTDIFDSEIVTDISKWRKVPVAGINAAAKQLLRENSH